MKTNMKKFNMIAPVFAWLLFSVFVSAVSAQDELPEDAPKQNFAQPKRPNLLAELDLSAEQIRQLRRIDADKKPAMRAARQRVAEAMRRLDEIVYADETGDEEFETRLKELQTAQAEVFKIRFATEYAVRKVLTPAQLVKFRDVRQRFMQTLENRINQPNDRRPNQRLLNRQRRLRVNQ